MSRQIRRQIPQKQKKKRVDRNACLLVFILIFSGILTFLLLTARDNSKLNSTLDETFDFVKNRIESYEIYNTNDQVKSLVRLLDKTTELSRVIEQEGNLSTEMLDEYAREQRLTGILVLDQNLKVTEQSAKDDRILGNPFYCGTVVWNGVEFEGNHEVRLSRERYEKRQKLITSRKRPVKARNVSACKHWLSGLLKCSVCGATLSYTGNNKCPYFQCWKYAKGFHKTSVALSVKKAEEAVISYFDQILDGAEFTYVCKKKKTDHSLQIDQLQREISKLAMREGRIKEAYEAGVDTLAEYKNNKDRLVSDRLELTAALSQLLQEEQSEQPNTEEVLKEIRSVADVLKNPDVGYEEKGNLIRSVVEQIIYDKESGKMSFDIIIS